MARSVFRSPFTPISAPAYRSDLLEKLRRALVAHSPRKNTSLAYQAGAIQSALLLACALWATASCVVCHLNHRLRGAAADVESSFVAAAQENSVTL